MCLCVCVCVSVCAHSLSRVSLWPLWTVAHQAPWTVAHQAPLSTGFSQQVHWSGLPFSTPMDLPEPGIEPTFPASPALQADSPPGKPCHSFITLYCGPLPCVMVKIKKSIKGMLNICLYAHLTMNIFFCLKSNCLVISCWETIPKLSGSK